MKGLASVSPFHFGYIKAKHLEWKSTDWFYKDFIDKKIYLNQPFFLNHRDMPIATKTISTRAAK
jgi:hypothetical protein